MSINDAKWTVAPAVLASSITSFLLLTFVKVHAKIFYNFSHSFSTAAFRCRNFHGLKHRNKFMNQVTMLQWILTSCCLRGCTFHNMSTIDMDGVVAAEAPAAASRVAKVLIWLHWMHDSHFFFKILRSTMGTTMFPISCEHSSKQWNRSVVFFRGVDEIDSTQFSCIVKMNLFFSPFLLFLQLGVLSHWLPYLWP